MLTKPCSGLRRTWAALLVILLIAACAAAQPAPATPALPEDPAGASTPTAAYDWLQFNGDAQHSGSNTMETLLGAGNAGRLKVAFNITLPAPADDAPAYLAAVPTPAGVRDLLFLTTTDGRIVAVDAHTGSQVWANQYGPGSCTIAGGSRACYTTASPAVDPGRAYVYSYGLDGRVHKLAVGDGSEVSGGGWPATATRKGSVEKGSSALTVAQTTGGASYLYVAHGGYPGDAGDYQGHVTAINLADGTEHIFNLDCSDQAVHFVFAPATPNCPAVQSAVWARAGVVYLAATDRIYAATGNGDFDPAHHNWGDSVFALHADATGAAGDPLATYTPPNFQALQNADADLGSTAPAILPVASGSKIAHLAVQGGKDAQLRLLNLDNLSGQGGIGHTGGEVATLPIPQGGEMLTAAAVWRNPAGGATWTFIANNSGIAGLELVLDVQGNPTLQPRWHQPQGGSSPLIANGVLYYAGTGQGIRALDPQTGRQLWQDATSLGPIHWSSPIVANGRLYITDALGRLIAYGLPLPPRSFLPDVSR